MANPLKVYGWEMALVSEAYLSTLSAKMKPFGMERYFVPFIHICENTGAITQKDLATFIKRDKVTVMRMVDYYEAQGLAQRQQNPKDKRSQILVATKKGSALLPQIKKAISETNEVLFGGFTNEEQKAFDKGMDKLITQLEQLPASEFIIHAKKRKKD